MNPDDIEGEELENAAEGFESILPDGPEPDVKPGEQPELKEDKKVGGDTDLELAEDETTTTGEEIELGGEKFSKDQLKAIVEESKRNKGLIDNYNDKVAEAEKLREQTQSERDYYAAKLGLEAKKIQEELIKYEKVDWIKLLNEQPHNYQKHRAHFDLLKDNLKAVVDERTNFFEFIETELGKKNQQAAIRANNELRKHFKNWNQANYEALIEYGVTKGFNKQFLLQTTDPQIFKMLHQQKTFDKATGKFTTPEKKNVVSIGSGKNRGTQPKKTSIDRLRATGSSHDAVSAFEDMLG